MDEEEKLPKFRVVWSSASEEFESKVNALLEVGYKIRNIVVDPDLPNLYRAFMMLSGDAELSDAVDMARIELDTNKEGTPLLAKMLREGWVVTSEYSKAVQLMKPSGGLQGRMKT